MSSVLAHVVCFCFYHFQIPIACSRGSMEEQYVHGFRASCEKVIVGPSIAGV